MQVSDLTVEVRDASLARVGQIPPLYLAGFEATLRLNNVGNWSLTLPAGFAMADALRETGAGIVVTGPNGVLLSGPTTNASLSKTTDDPEGIWTISGVDDSVHLADRLAYPDPSNVTFTGMTQEADVLTGAASTVMCHYVNTNLGPVAHSSRQLPGLLAAVDPVVGSTVTGSARFDVLGELLSNLAALDGLGFDLKQSGDDLIFSVFEPVDRSGTIRMDISNNTLSSSEYGYASPQVTRAIVGGEGKGIDRSIVNVSTTTSVASESAWGRRIERFIDENNESDTGLLTQKGEEELAKNGDTLTSVEIVPSSELTMVYGVDWNLGDLVGVTVGSQQVAATVTTVALRVDADGVRVGATVGEPQGVDYEALVSRKQTQTSQRVNSLERKESLALTFPLSLENGGTGSTTLAAAKTALEIPTLPSWMPFAMAAGRVSITVTASNAGSAAVTLPVGRFTQTPIITANIVGTTTGASQSFVARVAGVTSTGFTAYAISATNSTQTITMVVEWTAIQMTSANAAG